MSRERVYGDGPKCMGCGSPAVWSGFCQMEDGRGFCNNARFDMPAYANTSLQSPCGPVEIPRPTRAALIASARDWAQQIRLEDAHDVEKISPRDCGFIATRLRRHAEKIEQALGELAMMEEK